MFCKIYIQCRIIIQRVVTIYGLPRVQLSRMINIKISLAKNKCMCTILSNEMIPISRTYPARKHYKNAYFMLLYNLTPTFIIANFL